MQVLLSKGDNAIQFYIPANLLSEMAAHNPDVQITLNAGEKYRTLKLLYPIAGRSLEKIKAIKLYRELTGAALTESKEFIESERQPTFKCPESQVDRALREFYEFGFSFSMT
jgi:ribosomal protein L7/L12